MISRRRFIGTGLSAAAIGLLSRKGLGLVPPTLGGGRPRSGPILPLPRNVPTANVGGFPFARHFTGDHFNFDQAPFHANMGCFGDADPPAPSGEIDVAVVGGGISGLTTAYLLRDYNTVLFELRDRVGGTALGEYWRGVRYSLGNAYVITPDAGTFLGDLYTELKLPDVVRVDDGEFLFEAAGTIMDDYLDPASYEGQDALAMQRYQEIVQRMANKDYPDIPLPDGRDNQWILDLDRRTLRQDIEEQMDMPIPDALAQGIQAYCHSSFSAGWEEISAASGWNFLAAEEFGRWVFPGGSSYIAHQLWRGIVQSDPVGAGSQSGGPVRSDTMVVDVRPAPNDKVQVTYVDRQGNCTSLLAKRAVMCCPKNVCFPCIHQLPVLDQEKSNATQAVKYRAYLVVNVLIDAPLPEGFYDIFLLGGAPMPMSQEQASHDPQIIDMLNGHYAAASGPTRSVLTLYWPLAWDTARTTLMPETAWESYAESAAAQIKRMLQILEIPETRVEQVRMTRWAHAMPLAAPGLIADGITDHLRRPIDNRIYFVNQDNWALPAVENCMLDAEIYVPQVAAGL